MPAPTLMIQGTASHVGKSMVVAAACRWMARRGLRVTPFKAVNMSLNSAVTAWGEEIGRSQAFQAGACGVEAEAGMNPILLKPMAGARCAVILRGRPYRVTEPGEDPREQRHALETIRACLDDLRSRFDVVVIEGMGSPAEINLRERDLGNMRTAELADAPVLLVGDIERGGVFAALAGTLELLSPAERARVRGFLVNKFHGDPAVLRSGLAVLERRYGVPTLGVLPWLNDLRSDEEDAVALDHRRDAAARLCGLDVVVPHFPTISNFTDLAPLEAEPDVRVRYVQRVDDWGSPDLVVLPGSRSVTADLHWLRETGLAARLLRSARPGGEGPGCAVIGLCGGFQMLGRGIHDPEGVESREPRVEGLGLLDVETTFAAEKVLGRAEGVSLVRGLEGAKVTGYEIHHGRSALSPGVQPAFQIDGGAPPSADGATDAQGQIFGSYLHGLFDSASFRHALLRRLGVTSQPLVEPDVYDRLADWFEENIDTDALSALLGLPLARRL